MRGDYFAALNQEKAFKEYLRKYLCSSTRIIRTANRIENQKMKGMSKQQRELYLYEQRKKREIETEKVQRVSIYLFLFIAGIVILSLLSASCGENSATVFCLLFFGGALLWFLYKSKDSIRETYLNAKDKWRDKHPDREIKRQEVIKKLNKIFESPYMAGIAFLLSILLSIFTLISVVSIINCSSGNRSRGVKQSDNYFSTIRTTITSTVATTTTSTTATITSTTLTTTSTVTTQSTTTTVTYYDEESNEIFIILNTSTRCYHIKSSCSAARRIESYNRKEVYSTREEIEAKGYWACGNCAK